MAKREKMSPVDTAWLRMDRPSNLMMIVGVITFADRMDFDRLRLTLERRMTERFRRFRQRVHYDPAGTAWWEDDPDFDIGHHLVRRALPSPPDKKQLQHLASELAGEPLNAGRPLWRFDFIENYDGGSALIARIHHCIADGVALVGVVLSMADLDAQAPMPEPQAPPAKRHETEDPWAALIEPMTDATLAAIGMTTKFWNGYLQLLRQPDLAVRLGKEGMGFAAELGKLLTMPGDSKTRLKGKPGTEKRVAWCEPIPLDEVKAIDKALGCSVNDVLLTAVAGALRSYLMARGDSVDGVEIRALVPVNLRSEKDAGELGNRFGLVTLLLPIHEANPFARLFEIRRRMQEMKGSFQAPLTYLLLGVAGLAPKLVQEKFLDMLAEKASAVMTNVPGPRQPLFLAGNRIDQCVFWVPQSGDIGIGVSILSYNNAVQFGLITDRLFIPDPDEVIPHFAAEFEKMVTALMLCEWGKPVDPSELEHLVAAAVAETARRRPARKSAVPTRRAPAATGGKSRARPRREG